MDALIESITELVLAELSREHPLPVASQPAERKRKLLLCPVPGGELSAPVWEALRGLDVAWSVAVWPGFPASAVDASLGHKPWSPATGAPDDLVHQFEAVVLPVLNLDLLPRLALLLGDTPPVQLAVAALVQGVPVLAAPEEVDRFRRHAARLPAGLLAVVQQHLRAIEALGVRLLPARALAQELSGSLAVGSASRGRDVITQEDLLAAVQAGQQLFEVASGAIVTPLALETARQRGIEVRYR